MRLGLALQARSSGFDGLHRDAARAERVGLDLVWIDRSAGGFIAAAGLATRTTTLRFAVCTEIERHPLEIAEAAVVADQCSNGRVIVVLADGDRDGALLEEAAEVVLAATAPKPFRHAGTRWQIPAHLPEHLEAEETVRVTPPPAQIELPLWLCGPGSQAAARRFGLSHVAGEDEDPDATAAAWQETDRRLGAVARRLRRPALRQLALGDDGALDAGALVARLRAEQTVWGLDTVVFRLPGDLPDEVRDRVLMRLATEVAPLLQLGALPEGLEQHWQLTGPSMPERETG